MKKGKSQPAPAQKRKVAIIYALFTGSIIITLLGVLFCAYSLLVGSSFIVLGAKVPGFVFGLCVAYVGVRNYLSVKKFRPELYSSDARFSWDNFKVLRPKFKTKAGKSGAR